LATEQPRLAQIVGQCPAQAQAILDELAGQAHNPARRTAIGNPLAYARTLTRRALAGEFIPEAALRVAAAREQRHAAERAQQRERADRQRAATVAADPRQRAAAAAWCLAHRAVLAPRRESAGRGRGTALLAVAPGDSATGRPRSGCCAHRIDRTRARARDERTNSVAMALAKIQSSAPAIIARARERSTKRRTLWAAHPQAYRLFVGRALDAGSPRAATVGAGWRRRCGRSHLSGNDLVRRLGAGQHRRAPGRYRQFLQRETQRGGQLRALQQRGLHFSVLQSRPATGQLARSPAIADLVALRHL
jgi:hypothetical protein